LQFEIPEERDYSIEWSTQTIFYNYCKITGWKFVCSKCYDKVYALVQRP
jgi:hypothetical protein